MIKIVRSNQVVVDKSFLDSIQSEQQSKWQQQTDKWEAIQLEIVKKRQKRETTQHILFCVILVAMLIYIGILIRHAIVNTF